MSDQIPYRSESPSQVFVILILAKVKNIGDQDVFLAYYNMCNLAKLKVARDRLPFPPPLDKLWLNVNKVIDVFHFQNHVSAECREKFLCSSSGETSSQKKFSASFTCRLIEKV